MALIQISKHVVSKVSFWLRVLFTKRDNAGHEKTTVKKLAIKYTRMFIQNLFWAEKRKKECIHLSEPQFYYNVWYKMVKITRFHDEAVWKNIAIEFN